MLLLPANAAKAKAAIAASAANAAPSAVNNSPLKAAVRTPDLSKSSK